MDDEPFYEIVAEEIATGELKRGLWTKALALADGKAEQAKAVYIRLRVEQLIIEAKSQARRAKAEASAETSRRRAKGCESAFVKAVGGGLIAIGLPVSLAAVASAETINDAFVGVVIGLVFVGGGFVITRAGRF